MDTDKRAYFLAKFSAASAEELQEAVARVHELADEAAVAVRQVATEKGMQLPPEEVASQGALEELTPEERAKSTKLSSSLWNSSISKHVQYMFSAQAVVFSFAFLGPQGLRVGALWLLLFAAPVSWAANRLGRQYTRRICADADRPVDFHLPRLENLPSSPALL